MDSPTQIQHSLAQLEQASKQRLIDRLNKTRVGKFSPNVGTESTLEHEVGAGANNTRSFTNFTSYGKVGRDKTNADYYQEIVRPSLPDGEEDGGGMGKRTITVEVTGVHSSSLRAGDVVIAKPQDLEVEGSAILDAYHQRQAGTHNDGALIMHTTVSARLVDATTGTVVLEVFPFLVRTSLTSTQADMSDWVGSVRDELAAGVHPAPCALYARRVSKGVDAAVPISGADVFSAAKAPLGVAPLKPSTFINIALRWSLHIHATVIETAKNTKEVPAPNGMPNVVEIMGIEADQPALSRKVDMIFQDTKTNAQGRIARFIRSKLPVQ